MKNLGASGYIETANRALETVVFRPGTLVLDRELNYTQEPKTGVSISSWLGRGPLWGETLFRPNGTANTLQVPALQALVDGIFIPVLNTGIADENVLVLPVPPTGAGSKRVDLVILEVWRRLLDDGPTGKSATGRLWHNGNVKVPSSLDATLNFADQMTDPVVGVTAHRVQIQYRLRVVQDVDITQYPSGIADPVVVAHSVPTAPGTPDGTATTFIYTNQSPTDAGLWRAGDGTINDLGTVDGYMYALPLCAVTRRNSTAWARNTNHNGGVAFPGPSDRPDGLFSDIVVSSDIIDLRQHCPTDFSEVGSVAFGQLLDNTLSTEQMTTTIGGGSFGGTTLWADEIGVLPGDGTITGDTPGAEFVGQFDCTRRSFSDRPIYEVLTYRVAPGDPSVSTASWQNGTVVTITPSLISQYPYPGTIGFLSRVPTGTTLIDVVSARVQGTLSTEKAAHVGVALDTSSTPFPVQSIQGLGTYPPGDITITMGTPPTGASTEPIYIDILVAYPKGQGLTATAVDSWGSASFSCNNPASLPASSPVSYAAMSTLTIDGVHREARLLYTTSTLTFTAVTSVAERDIRIPERASTLVEVRKNGTPDVGAALSDASGSGRVVRLSGVTTPNDVIEIDYVALRPIPQSGVQFTVYYQRNAAQTVHDALLGTSKTFIPRWISPALYTMTCGSASNDEAYPYPQGYVQIPAKTGSGPSYAGDFELDGSASVAIADYSADTGFLKLPAYVPYVPSPYDVTFSRTLGSADIEGRTFFDSVTSGYLPNAFATPFPEARRHKVVLPCVMELATDSSLGSKGELFLVTLQRWATDAENSVKFLPSNNATVSAVYRLNLRAS